MIKRRLLAAALAAFAARPARAQSRVPVVGFLGFASAASDRVLVEALREGMAARGHVEGRSYRLENRHAEGRLERVGELIAELIARQVVVFVVPGQAAARILSRATKLPIVAVALPPSRSDPDLFASLARPGGTVTGFSNFTEELAGKRIELIKEVMPGLKAIGVLHNTTDPTFRDWGVETAAAARMQGLEPIRLGIASIAVGELAQQIRTLRPAGAGALIVIRDFLTQSLRDDIQRLALEEGVATVGEARDLAEAGYLMSYGADAQDMFRRAADYVDRILKGANPGELPIQLATKLELVINLKTARALAITVPHAILLRADEVIE